MLPDNHGGEHSTLLIPCTPFRQNTIKCFALLLYECIQKGRTLDAYLPGKNKFQSRIIATEVFEYTWFWKQWQHINFVINVSVDERVKEFRKPYLKCTNRTVRTRARNWNIRHACWIKIDQLDVTCFIISLFTAQHVSNVSTFILRSLRLIVDLFHVLCCSGSMCVGVSAAWCGILMQAEAMLQPA